MRRWLILILCLVILLPGCRTTRTSTRSKPQQTTQTASVDENKEACLAWCKQREDCDKCTLTRDCGARYKVMKSWTRGRDWYACQRITSSAESTSSGTATADRTAVAIQKSDSAKAAVKAESAGSSTPTASGAAVAIQKSQSAKAVIKPVSSYDFFANVKKATWKSSAGPVTIGKRSCATGCVLPKTSGRINPGNKANKMLVMLPPERKKGRGTWIEGRFPPTLIGDHVKFKSTAAFVEGVSDSDGGIFTVYADVNGRKSVVIRKTVNPQRYEPIEADLTKYRGKVVRIVLHVHCRKTSTQDKAVWVAPKLTHR